MKYFNIIKTMIFNNNALINAVQNGNLEIVASLLTIPHINVNKYSILKIKGVYLVH